MESEEVVVARILEKPIVAWCPECKAETQKLTMTQAARLYQVDQNIIREKVHSGKLHVSETPAGGLLICLRSLS
jgi:hypothetical protein